MQAAMELVLHFEAFTKYISYMLSWLRNIIKVTMHAGPRTGCVWLLIFPWTSLLPAQSAGYT